MSQGGQLRLSRKYNLLHYIYFFPYIFVDVRLKFFVGQWCSCLINSLQPPLCHLTNPQGSITAYQSVDISMQLIFIYSQRTLKFVWVSHYHLRTLLFFTKNDLLMSILKKCKCTKNIRDP